MLRRLSVPLPKPDVATAALVLTELVTNAIRHGCGGREGSIGVIVSRSRGTLRFEVVQPGSLYDLETVRRRRPGEERGYGVLLLDRLCRGWGVDAGAGIVWAELDVDRE